MKETSTFSWHHNARLFAGNQQIARPGARTTTEFKRISHPSSAEVLGDLGQAIVNGQPFCVSENDLPQHSPIAPSMFLTLTGGSAGHPKVICRTQESWIKSFAVNADLFSYRKEDSLAVFGKLSHSLALYGVLEALHSGLDAHVLGSLPAHAQRAELRARGISILYVTPTQLRLLASRARTETLPEVRLILCGGGMLDHPTRAAAQRLFPQSKVHVFYGAAETSFITLADENTPLGSVGHAYPGVAMRIRDESGLETKDVGEVWVQSPYVFDNYLSQNTTLKRSKDGFLSVGEMGQLDARGNLWLKGRKTRMVTIADRNVYPEAIETLINASLEGGTCAIVPIPDQTRGHRLIAVLEGAQNAAMAESVKAICRAKLGALMTPHRVLFHPSLPLLASGKIDLISLTNWVEDQL